MPSSRAGTGELQERAGQLHQNRRPSDFSFSVLDSRWLASSSSGS